MYIVVVVAYCVMVNKEKKKRKKKKGVYRTRSKVNSQYVFTRRLRCTRRGK